MNPEHEAPGGPETARPIVVGKTDPAPDPGVGNGKQPVTLDQIKQAKDVIDAKEVEVPEWGLTVKIRGLTRGEMRHINDGLDPEEDGEKVNARAMALAMIEPRMTEEEAFEILDSKGMKSTSRITDAIMEASGITAGFLPG